jgi:hypothetical protein
MKIFSRILFIFTAAFLMSFAACNDNGSSDSDTAQAEAPVYDATGKWIINMVYTQDYGMNACELIPDMSHDTITQSGSTFSLDGKAGGYIDGTNYLLQYSYSPSSGVTCTITFAFAMTSEDAFKGTATVYATNGSQSVERTMNMEARRAGAYTYNAAGTWQITANINGINYCGKQTTRKFNITFEQETYLFYLTGDFDGDGNTEAIPGAMFGTECKGIAEPVDDSNVTKGFIMEFKLSSENSLSGTLEVYDCKSGDCVTTYTITGTRLSD